MIDFWAIKNVAGMIACFQCLFSADPRGHFDSIVYLIALSG
jgi:hypothetical protein